MNKRKIESFKSIVWQVSCRLGELISRPQRNVIWLIGSGRSGTTWLSEIINYDGLYREIFEPFHPVRAEDARFLELNHYASPARDSERLRVLAKKIFSGRIYGRRTDLVRRLRLYRGLLIKDVFALLFANWVSKRFPQVKIILLIRNPFAVALSTYKTRDWVWMTDPRDFLKQKDLVSDHLMPFKSLIESIGADADYFTRQILVWSIVNYVILRQFAGQPLKVVFYEDLLISSDSEVLDVLKHVRGDDDIDLKGADLADLLKRPSKMIGKHSNLTEGSSPLLKWRDEITEKQKIDGDEILRLFSLNELYDKEGLPVPASLNSLTDTAD